ncbi:TIGR03118 family protein [Microbispora sp. ATCC PTA-5024]|uniref:TIGR03118 family protein n=1 Tax=Microbispora sp. ATCC PTA-5024 TaxID=316330 RepID=UPI0003DC8834|nr:TIGR03118 family protein [Microbispora sp. ATCC PTA-5024]ETK33431.1 hypothetical protein MPTA5024_24460 [Microbispora sp. ATCC PTA-5024]
MRIRQITLCAAALVVGATTTLPAHAASVPAATATTTRFQEIDLVADVAGRAARTDQKLVNPWGIAVGPRVWVSDADAGVATVYSGGGTAGPVVKEPLTVAVPGGPTGQVFNSGPHFVVHGPKGSGPAAFVFATESGTIQGWNLKADPAHAVVAAKVRRASFKGLALLQARGGPFLLAADFFHGRIVVFDGRFHRVSLPHAFRDPSLPRGYAPFNVAVVGGTVYVTYARQNAHHDEEVAGPGKGFVSRFTASGAFRGRLAARGPLNAPWAVTAAPASFGTFAGALLVGNFGDGTINAFTRNGRFLGPLRTPEGKPIRIDGLWGLAPGTAANGGANALWFAAGTDDEKHGLLGLIRPTPRKPGTGGDDGGHITYPPPRY